MLVPPLRLARLVSGETPHPSTGFAVGDRVELHPATDAWMQGDRFGTVARVKVYSSAYLSPSQTVYVRLDRSERLCGFNPADLTVVS